MKLYELILRRLGAWQEKEVPKEKSAEEMIYNPLHCKTGGVVKIENVEFRDHRFIVREILEHTIDMGRNKHKMVDYVLVSRPIGQPDVTVRLRLVPNDEGRLTHRALVMKLYDSMEYNDGLHNVVRDETLKFVVDDDQSDNNPDNDVHEEFYRVNDVRNSYLSKVKSLKDSDNDGQVDNREIKKSEVEFWDYIRKAEIDGVESEEFIFVEMNKENGFFHIWRGMEVISERIEVF